MKPLTRRPSEPIQYYDLKRHWTKRIIPHLADPELNRILVEDFNKFTLGRWSQPFQPGEYPADYETCLWDLDRRGPRPRYWRYVKHAACHWLVNFALRLATLAEPTRPWRIITSDRHSTVWDGRWTLFDLNFMALGVEAQQAFELAYEQELPVGELLEVHFAPHFSTDRRGSRAG